MFKLKDKKQKNSSNKSLLSLNLQKAIKGSSIIFIGAIIGRLLLLISAILVARFFTVGEFGLFGLSVFILSFVLNFASLHVAQGCSRFISFYRGKKDYEKIKGTISSSLTIVILSSITFSISLYLLSDLIALEIFSIADLSPLIKILALSIPFLAIKNIIIAIFRGFEKVKEQVYFTNLLVNIFSIFLFSLVIYLKLPFIYIILSYAFSIVLNTTILIVYYLKKIPNYIAGVKKTKYQTKTLLNFSLPLVFSGLGYFLITGSDKIFIGIILSEFEVGIYNVATSIGSQIILLLVIITFIYLPIATRLLAEDKLVELKRFFQILTKWLFTLTFPFIIILLLFPEAVISLFFGDKYLMAATALQLLVIGYFFHVFLGPNGETIKIFDKTKMFMIINLFGGFINVVLNILLIPIYGIEGAAFSTMISLILINVLHSYYLYKISKINPLRKKFVNPVIITFAIIILFYFLVLIFELQNLSILLKLIIGVIFGIVYFLTILFSKSFDEEDLQLLLLLEKKFGMRLNFLEKIIDKFV